LPAQPKRRFLKLNVGEVSLVDSPANEVEFLVTKNLEDQVMGEQQETAERVVVEQPAGESDVASVLKHVNAIVENIANVVVKTTKASPAAIAAATGAGDEESEEAHDAEVVDDADVEKSSFAAMMKAAGVKMTPEQMEKLKASGFDPAQKFPTAKKPAEKTTKAKATTDAEAFAETALTIEGLSSMISKAKKFTPGRIEKLKGAVEALKGLLEEIDSIPQGTNPGVSPGGSTSFGASGIKESMTSKSVASDEPSMSDVLKAVTGLAETVKGLAGKVETIEKARPASASLEAEGGTEKTVKKSASLWGGIL
jgi:hypothetical protein